MLFIAALVAILLLLIYVYNKKHYMKWKDAGVPGPKPSLIFGNVADTILLRKSLPDQYASIYR